MSRGILVDYKSGHLAVADPSENLQCFSYVLGAFQKYPELQTIDFYVLIPNRDEVLSHTFKREEAPELQLIINTVIRRAMEIDWSKPVDPEKLSPQSSLCEYCQNQVICPALAAKALMVGTKLSPGLPVPNSVLVDPKRPEDIPHLLRLAPLLEEWAKGVRKEALRLNLEEGIDVPGFKRIERSTPRGVTSVLGAYKAVKDQVPLEDFLAACATVSIVELEDYFASLAKRGGKGKARQDLENRLRSADVWKAEGKIYYLKEQKA
jgi:hypothetical protein